MNKVLSGKVYSNWLTVIVTPVQKVDSSLCMNDFRPISVSAKLTYIHSFIFHRTRYNVSGRPLVRDRASSKKLAQLTHTCRPNT